MKKILIITLICFSAVGIGIIAYHYTHQPANIFDEIYQDEHAGFHSLTRPFSRLFGQVTLNDIKGINNWDRDEATGEYAQMPRETYSENSLPTGISSAGYSFYFYKENEHMVMYFEQKIDDNIGLYFESYYDVKQKTLTKKLSITLDNEDGREYLKEELEINSYLDKYDISTDRLEQYYKEGMNDFMLSDWLSVYDSKFSADDWGEVTVVTEWK